MIVKIKDSKQEEINELSLLLKDVSDHKQRFLLERELKALKSGVAGEEDSAYYINFYFGSSKNWAVIHDLRLEYDNFVAQIDHILIGRAFDMYVLESKNFYCGISITNEGEFEAHYKNQCFGIPSPIEQNKRHIHVLQQFFKTYEVLPRRLGIEITPKFKSLILFSPKSVIKRPSEKKFDTGMIIKADTLRTKIDEEINKFTPISDITSVVRICSSSTIREFAEKLASYHKPSTVNFRAKFGIGIKNSEEKLKEDAETSKYYCFQCKKSISEKVAKYCWNNKDKFGGKAYCLDCQNRK